MKAKMFYNANIKFLEHDINTWLSQNSNIEIVSTNSFASVGALGYIILYREKI